jgi:adenine-specific DNA-methyltransferase
MPKRDYSQWDKKDLISQIEKLEKRKKYGLVWDDERTREVFELQAQNSLPILENISENDVINDSEQPTHILIEGDNYHALSVLNYTHENNVDVIFIDPPYNKGIRGSNDFRYNDRFVDNEDSFRHSKWLSFMEKRLRLARNVLKTTGVIFITISDEEVHHLRCLLDDIFGEQNFVANVVWQKKQSPQNDATYLSDMHDHILVYAKKAKKNKQDPNGWQISFLKRTEKQNARAGNPDNDPRGPWISSDYTCNKTSEQRPNLYYALTNPFSKKKVYPSRQRVWRYEKSTYEKHVRENRIWWGSIGEGFPRLKKFVVDLQKGIVPSTWWERELVGDNQEARRELREILNNENIDFDTPKPVRLIKHILSIATQVSGDEIVLDFFAGSGTTAHAVQDLNEEDGGNRQCILVTNNENNIMKDICYPRVKRVMEGYEFIGSDKKLLFEEDIYLTDLKKISGKLAEYEKVKQLNHNVYDELKGEFSNKGLRLWGINHIKEFKTGLNGNLKFYRTSFVPSETCDENKETLTHKSVEMLCLKESTFELVSEKDVWKIYKNNNHYTAILFDQLSIPDIKEEIKKLNNPISVYVFSLEDDNFANEFSDQKDKVNVCSIPEAILNVYRRIYK